MLQHCIRPRGLLSLCLSLVMLTTAGCLPEEQWLDDSSGFVYAFAPDATSLEIRFYDVAQRADRVVWSGAKEAGVHLDSAAKVLYLIEHNRGQGQRSSSYRLSRYDIKSNRLVRSTRWMNWARNNGDSGQLILTSVPKRQSHFLVIDVGRKGLGGNAILNADTESLIDVPDGFLEVVPDGSGFLARNLSAANMWQESLKSKKKLDRPAIEKLCQESLSFVIVDHTGNIVDSLVFPHFDNDQFGKVENLIPDDPAVKQQ